MRKTIRIGRSNMYVIYDTQDNLFFLRSYDTIVAMYDPAQENLVLGKYWDCSVTTSKHLRKFLKEYATPFCNLSVPEIRKHIKRNDDPRIIYQDYIA